MRAVADTNVVVSGLLWGGPPRQVLDLAREGRLVLCTSAALLAELEEVLARPKFATRLKLAQAKARDLALGYAALALFTRPSTVEVVVPRDPDDDEVLACAVAAEASLIISGDHHLLELGRYRGIDIVTAQQAVQALASRGAEARPALEK